MSRGAVSTPLGRHHRPRPVALGVTALVAWALILGVVVGFGWLITHPWGHAVDSSTTRSRAGSRGSAPHAEHARRGGHVLRRDDRRDVRGRGRRDRVLAVAARAPTRCSWRWSRPGWAASTSSPPCRSAPAAAGRDPRHRPGARPQLRPGTSAPPPRCTAPSRCCAGPTPGLPELGLGAAGPAAAGAAGPALPGRPPPDDVLTSVLYASVWVIVLARLLLTGGARVSSGR